MRPSDDADFKQFLYVALLTEFKAFIGYFYRAQYGREFVFVEFHDQIIRALIRVVTGETKRLIINIPPRFGKTELAVKMFVAWCLANNPAAKFIHLSYSDDLALDNSSAIRDLVKTDAYQELFPTPLKADSDSKKKWYTQAGGGLYATSAGGAITGFGAGAMRRDYSGNGSPADGFAGCIIIDDPVKPDDAFSDVMRDRINRRFNNTIASRVNSQETPIIVIMQRLHEADMSGFLLDGGSGEEWEHLCIAVIDEDGESIWPEKVPTERLRVMEEADSYTFAGQYMQRPSPLGGGIIKPDNIQIVDAIPAGPIEWVRGWDLAASITGDWTAGPKIGRMKDGRFIIADMVRLRAGPDDRDKALLNTAARDGFDVTISIPQDPGQAGKSQVAYLARQLAGYYIKSSPETGDKVVRASPLAAQINVGNVLMLRAEWNNPLVAELRVFPNGKFDDQVDGLSRGFAELIGRYPAEIFFASDDNGLNARQKTAASAMPGLPNGVIDALAGAPEGEVCGRCSSFDADAGSCKERGFLVRPGEPGCHLFIAATRA